MLGLKARLYFFPLHIMEDQTTPATKADMTRVESSIARIDANIDTLTKLVTGMRSDILTWKDEVIAHFDDVILPIQAKFNDFTEIEQTAQSHEKRIARLEEALSVA